VGANHNPTKDGVPGELLVQVSTGQFAVANYDINGSTLSMSMYPSLVIITYGAWTFMDLHPGIRLS
jgi:hypothetical protein